jgi:hypothetical protein
VSKAALFILVVKGPTKLENTLALDRPWLHPPTFVGSTKGTTLCNHIENNETGNYIYRSTKLIMFIFVVLSIKKRHVGRKSNTALASFAKWQ